MMHYYGDETRWFIGIVMSITDPLELGRVQIRIFGVHGDDLNDVAIADLPWAQVVVPVTEGQSSGIGANTGIKEQSQVFGIFLDGKDSQLPLVFGAIPKIESSYARRNKNIDLFGETNVEQAYNYFISAEGGEFSPQQASGIIGNLLTESNIGGDINPLQKNSATGAFGIAQWLPSEASDFRLSKLRKFSQERKYDQQTLFAQLEYIKYELHKYSQYGLSDLRNSKTPKEASIVFESKYLDAQEGSTEKRISFAEEVFEKMEL